MHRVVILLAATLLLAGCPVPQPQNTPVDQWQEHNPVTSSSYYVYVPSTYRHDTPAPVIVTCHGTPPFDVSEHHIREWKDLGETYGCIIIAPAMVGTDGILGDGPLVAMKENERRILSIICQLGYRYNLDLNNMMITGFSGGGFPVYWVGLRHPDVFSVLALRNCNFSEGNLDGWYPPEARRTPVIIYYGSVDPAAIKFQSNNGIDYLRSRGFTVTPRIIPGAGHDRHPEVAMEFFRRHWRTSRPSLPNEQ